MGSLGEKYYVVVLMLTMMKTTTISPAKYWRITENGQENDMQEKEILTDHEKKRLNAYCAEEIYQYGSNYWELKRIFDSYKYMQRLLELLEAINGELKKSGVLFLLPISRVVSVCLESHP